MCESIYKFGLCKWFTKSHQSITLHFWRKKEEKIYSCTFTFTCALDLTKSTSFLFARRLFYSALRMTVAKKVRLTNRPSSSYSRYRTETSLQLRLMQGVLSNKNDIYLFWWDSTDMMRVNFKLIPVQDRQCEYGIFSFRKTLITSLKMAEVWAIQISIIVSQISVTANSRQISINVLFPRFLRCFGTW